MSLAVRLESASTEFQKIQLELQNAVEARQRLDAQLNENELVKKVRHVPQHRSRLALTADGAGVRAVDTGQCRLQADRPCPNQAGPGGGQEQCRYATVLHPGRDVRGSPADAGSSG